MKKVFALILVSSFLAACQTNPGTPENQAEIKVKREKILAMADEGLKLLYASKPDARAEVEGAVGYAVFDTTSINVILLVGANGPGVIIDNKTKEQTFMSTVRAGTGPGIGYQELYQIFIFKSAAALDQFKLGGKVGGDLVASTTVGTTALQASANPYISVYQVSQKGFALQANWGGALFIVDDELNAKPAESK